jgi:hypothetical protein
VIPYFVLVFAVFALAYTRFTLVGVPMPSPFFALVGVPNTPLFFFNAFAGVLHLQIPANKVLLVKNTNSGQKYFI